jgi:hypothetical protein
MHKVEQVYSAKSGTGLECKKVEQVYSAKSETGLQCTKSEHVYSAKNGTGLQCKMWNRFTVCRQCIIDYPCNKLLLTAVQRHTHSHCYVT